MTKTSLRILVLAAASSILLSAGAAAALAQQYPSDLSVANPRAFAAWKAAVPAVYRKVAWIARFEGVTVPMERATVDGKPSFAGWACKPHDCGGNKVAFVIALDGSSVAGLVVADAVKPARKSWGAQTPQSMQLLERLARD